jgi:DNA-binding phage protein
MAKISVSKKQKTSGKEPILGRAEFENLDLKNSKLVSETLMQSVQTGDLDSFRDALASRIMSANKVHLAKKSGLGRKTLYDLIDPKRNFDPSLSTVSAIIRGLAKC